MHDVIVVGSGAGGGAAAWRFASQGLRVLVLEAGPWFDPAKDYSLDKPDWERHAFPVKPGSQGRQTFAPMQALESRWDDIRSWDRAYADLPKRAQRAVTVGYSHVRGVGGSTLHYVGEAHRMHPQSMQLATRHGVGADWPISYADLEPYYQVAETVIGVAGDHQGPLGPAGLDPSGRWRSAPYPLPPHTFCPASVQLGQGAQRLKLNWVHNPRAALSRPYDGRPPCNQCGGCAKGCPRRDKGSVDQTFVPKALASGRCEIRARATVTRLLHNRLRVVQGVEYVDENGRKQQAMGRCVVLACGAVETPRLLLNNRSSWAPQGIGNDTGQVGQHFLETVYWMSTGLHPDRLDSFAGLPADAICWDFNRPDAIPGVIGGMRMYSATLDNDLTGPMAYATRVLRGWGAKHKLAVRETLGRALSVGAIGESLPHPKSFIDLDPKEKDALGMPLARIHSHMDEMACQRLQFMARQCRAMLKAAGVSEIINEGGTYDTFSSSHVFGTCRMGASPATSVLGSDGRVHGWDNLLVCDASSFPSSGGGESPSLTIQALAIRSADLWMKRATSR
jgi:choline dehydrogenase-like flavoprotein